MSPNLGISACENDQPSSNGYPHDTRTSLDYTYSLDKLSCVRQFYFIHLMFAYFVVFSGIACFLTRLHPPSRPWHAFCGRAYILSMLWCMATSLLIHNTGLPIAVLISFLIVLVGMTVGWVVIKVHQECVRKEVIEKVQGVLAERVGVGCKENAEIDLEGEMKKAVIEIQTRRSLLQRMLSFKALHGMLMFMSWINMAGRLFGGSNQSGDFTCYTYPVYKKLDSPRYEGLNRTLKYLSIEDPHYDKLPWKHTTLEGWVASLSIGALLFAFGIGFVHTCYVMGYVEGNEREPPASDTENENRGAGAEMSHIMPRIEIIANCLGKKTTPTAASVKLHLMALAE